MPGGGPFVDPPGAVPDPAAITARLDALENTAAELEDKLKGNLEARLGALQRTADGQAALMEGHLKSRLDALDLKAGKIAEKLVKNVNRKLGNVYNYAFPYGIVYPTNEQAYSGLTGGDIFESMGLTPLNRFGGLGASDAHQTYSVGAAAPLAEAAGRVPLQPAASLTGAAGNDALVEPRVVPIGAVVGNVPPAPVPIRPGLPPLAFPPVNPGFIPIPPGGGFRPGDRLPGGGIFPGPGGPAGQGGPGPDGWIMGPFPGVPGALRCRQLPTGHWECDCGPGMRFDELLGCVDVGGDTGGGDTELPEQGPPPREVCPPGMHFEDGPPGPPVKTSVPVLHDSDAGFSLDGQVCPAVFNTAVLGIAGEGWRTYHDTTVWQAVVIDCDQPPPDPPETWDVVQVHHSINVDGRAVYQDFCCYIPAGFELFTDAASGTVLALNEIPPWGCRIGEQARFRWVPGPRPRRCVPDVAAPPSPGAEPFPPNYVCPIPDVANCGPGFAGSVPKLGDDRDNCKGIADAVGRLQAQEFKLSDWLGMQTGAGDADSTWKKWARMFTGIGNPILPDLVGRLSGWLQKVIQKTADGAPCDPVGLLPVAMLRGVLGLIQRWTDAIPKQVIEGLNNVSNTICQSVLPGVSEADQAYLNDQIDQFTWECWVKAAGHFTAESKKVRDGNRTRPSATQAMQLKMREQLSDERYEKLIRAGGVIDGDDQADLWQLQQWWPTSTNLIRWMKKDVFDQPVVDRFELDTDFEAKFTPALEQLAAGAGLTRDQMLREWRAHWQNVGTSSMFDALHRLRPEKVPAFLATTEEDVRQAMKQQDIPPFWIERLIALSYVKPTRVDVRRMWTLHLIEKDELKARVLDLGYTDADADKMVRFWQADRDMKEARMNGLPTGRTLVNSYGRGELTKSELQQIAGKVSYYDGQEEEIEEAADLARDMAERKAAIAGVRRRFTRGLIGRGDAAAELSSVGIDADEIGTLMRWWDQQMKRTGRQVTAVQLCQWRDSHLISAAEQQGALIRIGYSAQDAANIVAQCTLDLNQKTKAAQERAEAAAVKAATKAAQTEAAAARAATRKGRVTTPASPAGSANGAAGH